MKNHLKIYISLLAFFFVTTKKVHGQNNPFVIQKNGLFECNQKNYSFIGTNYWYGGFLLSDSLHDGKIRLLHELDFLKQKKINNLRVLLSAEGDSSYPYRVYPSLQKQPLEYNEGVMKGFDFLLAEATKRDLKIVFVLNNNWEWSGGFGQYLEWAKYGNAPLPKTPNWDWNQYSEYIAQFYTCYACKAWYNKWIFYVLNRENKITHRKYKDEPTIMAWELANEPRPMKINAVQDYKIWINETANYIKSIDRNHLVTIGVEGVISTLNDETIFSDIHLFKNIDYATIHLWPKTWQWYNGKSEESVQDSTLQKTIKYIEQHAKLMKLINKPLVIEEFGLHRDGNSFSSTATTKNRDLYYQTIFETGKRNQIAGYNFWGFAGVPSNENELHFMQKGMPYSADPPQEEQGLYSVFEKDTSTWKTISSFIKK
jgi:mannan endo-1,4-beta-mannosidase